MTHCEREHLPQYEVLRRRSTKFSTAPCIARELIGHDRVGKHPQYACENKPGCGLAQPPRETGLGEGNRFETSMASEIVTGKCGYPLPIFR